MLTETFEQRDGKESYKRKKSPAIKSQDLDHFNTATRISTALNLSGYPAKNDDKLLINNKTWSQKEHAEQKSKDKSADGPVKFQQTAAVQRYFVTH